MTGPKRELPPLVIRIISDAKKALKGMEDIVKGAKDMAKGVEQAIQDMQKAEKKASNDRLVRHGEMYRRMKKLDAAYRKEREVADKKSAERTLRANKKSVQDFINLASGQGKSYGRLTAFGKQLKGKKGPVSTEFADLVRRGVEGTKRLKLAAIRENATMRKADQERARLVEQSRKAIQKQTNTLVNEENKASSRARSRRRDRLRREKAEAEAEAKKGVQKFLNLGAGTGPDPNAFRLTPFGKRVAGMRSPVSTDFADLVKRGMAGTKKLSLAGIKESALQSRANAERARLVEQSRKAIQKQTSSLVSEEERATRRARVRRKRRLEQERKDIEDRAKALAKANAGLAALVKSGATAQQIQARKDHIESRRQSRRMWQRRKSAILQARQDAADKLAAQKKTASLRLAARLQAANQAFADQKAREAENRRQLRNSRLRQISRLKDMRTQGQAARKQIGQMFGGGMGANMMGARADMFMHLGGLRTMSQSAVGFLTPFAQVENATIQMRAYAGSAEAAKEIVEEMQRFAIESPYKLEGVLEATSMMMKYGQSAQNAMEITKMLGDVAAGDTDKLRLLGLAVGQATGFGRLQGQELRQMVNAGFNPLKTAARELAGGKGVATDEEIEKQMDFLITAMRKRQLDADIIKAALQVETAKGGDFAGIRAEQAKSLTGWANQFLETLDLIKIQITETFVDELKKGLETLVRYTEATVQWMKANKQLVKEYTMLGLKLLKYAIAFSVLGFAMATVKWVAGSLMLMMAPLQLAFTALTTAVQLFGNAAVIAWLKALGPIALGIAVVTALGVAIAAFRNENGLVGWAFDSMVALTYFLGFMYNFSENMNNIFAYFGANWKMTVMDFVMSPLYDVIDLLTIIGNFFTGFFGIKIPSFTGKMREMVRTNVGAGKHDTSMLKFDGPQIAESKMVKEYMAKIKKELDPFLPKPLEEMLKDKPNIDFKSFVKGAEGGAGKMQEHAVSGSAEHALRMYNFGQAAMANFEAQKKSSEKKQEELLAKIEKNTRQKAIGSGDLTIEDANLVLTAPGRID